ncbi:TonB-dependent receptor [Paraferrimonas sedimenticola]|uniref:TonB-dependent receptor n=1 Tax=Paraferrimonas sedimenticola TaxID=375674 RepID=A0AA37RW17_9GAMM|nr:TonB-dependent receptor [Paraferrimonas sedimenticola]GLP96349.1 TonB-dependent receptor [Paraferrimonas sedimenticola]
MKGFKFRHPLLAAAVVNALVPAYALAETAAEKEESIERIVVTARNKAEAINKIPVSVSAIGGEELKRTAIASIQDVIEETPGVTYDNVGSLGTSQPVIRGLAQPGLVGDETNVAVFIDGVYASGRDAAVLPLAGLERVEIVRGPQSAIYGRNAFAGAINYITKAPTQELTAGIDATIGTDERKGVDLFVSSGITDWARFRVDLSSNNSGSTIENIDQTTGKKIDDRRLGLTESQLARAKLIIEPTDSTAITLSHTYGDDKITPMAEAHLDMNAGFKVNVPMRPIILGRDGVQNPDGSIEVFPSYYSGQASRYIGELSEDLWKKSFTGVAPEAEGETRKSHRTALQFDYVGDDVSFTYIGGYNTSEYTVNQGQLASYAGTVILPAVAAGFLPDPSTIPGAPNIQPIILDMPGLPFPMAIYEGVMGYDYGGQPNDDRKEQSHEVRLSGYAGDLGWVVGGFYSKLDLKQSLVNAVVGADPYSAILLEAAGMTAGEEGIPVMQATDYTTDTRAVFASLSYDFSDDWNVTLEGRYTKEKKTADNHTDNRAPGFLFPTGEMEGDWGYFTPRVTIDYDLNEDSLLYLNVGKGVKSGGLNGGASGSEMTYDPEENWTYELGIKSFLFDDALKFNLAGYFIDWDKQQVRGFSSIDVPENSFPTVIVNNLGKTEVTGIELDTRWQINDNFGFNFGGNWNDAKVVKGGLGPDAGFLDYEQLGLKGVDYPFDPEQRQVIGPMGPIMGMFGPISVDVPPAGTMVSDGDVSGKDMPRTPKFTANASIDWIQGFGSFNGYAKLSVGYKTKQYMDSINKMYLPASYTSRLTGGIETASYRVGFYINNLTDKVYAVSGYTKYLWNGHAQSVSAIGQGRTAGINFSYKFN